jgi:hypothetical protein
LALRSLLQHHPEAARQHAGLIAATIFKDVHVPAMGQSIRQRAYEVLHELMLSDPLPPSLAAMQADLLRWVTRVEHSEGWSFDNFVIPAHVRIRSELVA